MTRTRRCSRCWPVLRNALVVLAACASAGVIVLVAPSRGAAAVAVPNPQPASNSPLPYVYPVENTGAAFPASSLPTQDQTMAIPSLPDPFAWANDPLGKTRSTDPKDWSRHRAEIKAMIEEYEIGTKPAVDIAHQVTATWTPTTSVSPTAVPPADEVVTGGTLAVTVRVKEQSLALSCKVTIPAGARAPYPILIAAGGSSLPAQAFASRGIVTVNYSYSSISQDGRPAENEGYFKLYPEKKFSSRTVKGDTGQYSAWAWGVSRVIDGLTLVQDRFPVDLKHIAVTGCSRNGKLALFAGALDERIALTIAQESGGGGATSWRVSATEPPDGNGKESVEGIGNTDRQWFASQMFTWAGENLKKLPEDHHMLCALVAPRALYVTGNTDYRWLSNKSCYVNSMAVARIYNELGIADRFGFCINGKHGHCAFPKSQDAELAYFLDKFMLGQTELSKFVATFPDDYRTIDYERWTKWWGTGDPELPEARKN
jgi:hypothetical protein